MKPQLSLVVVTWNSEEDLAGLVTSMNSNLPEPETVELIVIDNASTDHPGAIVDAWAGPSRLETLESNLGFGRACNRGVGLAAAPVCVLCNPDILLLDDSIMRLGEMARERSALIGPRLLWADGSLQPSASGPVTGIWPWIGAFLPGAIQPEAIQRRTEPWRIERTVSVTWLTGALIAAPTSMLRELGPFDESIELMSEDLDLCLRAGRAGIDCLFAPDVAAVIHVGGTAREKRFDDLGLALAQKNRRQVLERAFGSRAARTSTAALKVRLRLRRLSKRILGRDASAEAAELTALRNCSGSS